MKDKRVEYIDVLRGVTMILLFPRLLDKILPLDIKKYFFFGIHHESRVGTLWRLGRRLAL